MITRENYEAFFLDYHEGTLSENEKMKLQDFLEKNQELKDEFHSFSQMTLQGSDAVFEDKEKLYRSEKESVSEPDEKVIAYLEGDLNPEGRRAFERELVNSPKKVDMLNHYKKIRLIADTNIRFTHEKRLYRQSAQTVAFKWIGRVAAIFVLLFGINQLMKTTNQEVDLEQPHFMAEKIPDLIEPISETKLVADSNERNGKVESEKSLTPAIQKKKIPLVKFIPERKVEPLAEREIIEMEEIASLPARINTVNQNSALLQRQLGNKNVAFTSREYITLDQFLVQRAKDVKKEGILSVNKIAKIGLAFASELSGERINYKMDDKKVTSIEYESKLLAFTIPFKKE